MTPLKSQLPQLWIALVMKFQQTAVEKTATMQNSMKRSIKSFQKYCKAHPEFLFKTLPQLGKDLDRALEEGSFSLSPNSFKKRKGCCYPVFLQEYFKEIFEKDGRLKDRVNLHLLHELRTLCFLFYKFELPFSKEMEDAAYEKFKHTDNSVKTEFTEQQLALLRPVVTSLLPNDPFDIKPRHSGGATADHVNNLEKRLFRRYIPSLMDVYGPEYFFNTKYHAKTWYATNGIERAEPTSKVTLVPKDSRGPRIICMEPHERMFIQQGLMHKIYDHIENYSPAKGRINFTDQTINQRLAQTSSMSRKYATIDMKDASDMVSWELVKQVVPHDWYVALKATRSTRALLPNGEIVDMKKFAPMGSALCFPIEAIIFYSILSTKITEVWVYGDDIVVPTEEVGDAMDLLESYGLVINKDKSLHKGSFRESCGCDAYEGYNITPIRCKSVDYESVISLANNLATTFETAIGEAVIEWYESIVPTTILRLPIAYKDYGVLAFFTDRNNEYLLTKRRYNSNLQRYEIRCLTSQSQPKKSMKCIGTDFCQCPRCLHGHDMMFDYFTMSNQQISPNEETFCHELSKQWSYKPPRLYSSIKEYIDSEDIFGSTSSAYSDVDSNIGYVWVPHLTA